MARFRFRLEPLYKYRQHLLEQTEQALARLAAEEQLLVSAIEQCHAQLSELRAPAGGWTLHALQCRDAHRQQLWQRLQALEQQLSVVRAERQAQQRQLVERMQERDVLEKLRLRHYEHHQAVERSNEQRQLDEVALRTRTVQNLPQR